MTGFSDYWESEILDHLFGKGTYVPPIIHVALLTSAPDDDGVTCCEPVAGSYARVETSSADWTAASAGTIHNASAIEFPQASCSWGVVTHFAFYDGATGGHLLAYGPLASAATVAGGDTLHFLPGALIVTID